MTEALYDTPDYFSDYAHQFNKINDRVLEIVADPDTFVTYDFVDETAEIVRGKREFPAQQVAYAFNRLVLSTKSQPRQGIYAATEIGSHPTRTLIDSALLVNKEGMPYAVRTGILREDNDVLDTFSCTLLNKHPIEASRRLLPGNDELIDAIPLYTQNAAVRSTIVWILLTKPTGNELAAAIQYTLDKAAPKEEGNVATLLEYVKVRLQEEQAADSFAEQYGSNRPNFQELQDILRYLQS